MKLNKSMKTTMSLAAAMGGLALATGMANAALVHRYSFDTDASDSVGSADGTLFNGASVSGGALQLDQTSSDQYANLDAATIAIDTFSSVTMEAWWSHDTLEDWQRIYDFGDDTKNYIMYTPVGNPNNNPSQVSGITNSGSEQQLAVAGKLAIGSYHMAMTFDDATNTMTYYVNGALVAQSTSISNDLASIGTNNAYLGKAQFNDPYLDGSIDEFRIYDTALSGEDVAASFAAGPNAIPEPSTTALLGLGGLALILRRRR